MFTTGRHFCLRDSRGKSWSSLHSRGVISENTFLHLGTESDTDSSTEEIFTARRRPSRLVLVSENAPGAMQPRAECRGERSHEPVRRWVPLSHQGTRKRDPLQLDAQLFAKCLRKAPPGCSPGPGRCTNETLRICLDEQELSQLLFLASEDFAKGTVPVGVSRELMLATMTAVRKDDGEVGELQLRQCGKAVDVAVKKSWDEIRHFLELSETRPELDTRELKERNN